jgi:MFS family permease
VLVAALTMAVPVLVTAVLTLTMGLTVDESSESVGDTVGSWSTIISALLLQVSLVFVTACVAHVTSEAAIGRRTTLGATWAATHGRRWRLVGLAVIVLLAFTGALVGYVVAWVLVLELVDGVALTVLFGVVSLPAFVALMGWVWVRLLYLPAPVLVLEKVGLVKAIGRGYRLSSREFWRTLGIALLTLLITVVAAQMLAVPFSVAGLLLSDVVDPAHAALVLVLTQAVATVVASAFAAPFTAAVVALQYVDLRMRKEGYDVELMSRAGVLGR